MWTFSFRLAKINDTLKTKNIIERVKMFKNSVEKIYGNLKALSLIVAASNYSLNSIFVLNLSHIEFKYWRCIEAFLPGHLIIL